jgi:hypothetical protein
MRVEHPRAGRGLNVVVVLMVEREKDQWVLSAKHGGVPLRAIGCEVVTEIIEY